MHRPISNYIASLKGPEWLNICVDKTDLAVKCGYHLITNETECEVFVFANTVKQFR